MKILYSLVIVWLCVYIAFLLGCADKFPDTFPRLTHLTPDSGTVTPDEQPQPQPTPSPDPKPTPPPAPRWDWITDYGTALNLSQKQKRPMLLVFTGSGCAPCKALVRTTLSDPRVGERLAAGWVACVLDVERDTVIGDAMTPPVRAIPAYYVVVGEKRSIMQSGVGFLPVDEFLAWLPKPSSESPKSIVTTTKALALKHIWAANRTLTCKFAADCYKNARALRDKPYEIIRQAPWNAIDAGFHQPEQDRDLARWTLASLVEWRKAIDPMVDAAVSAESPDGEQRIERLLSTFDGVAAGLMAVVKDPDVFGLNEIKR